MQSIEENYRRDSFSHRVWDKLSEEVLQYLSIDDTQTQMCVLIFPEDCTLEVNVFDNWFKRQKLFEKIGEIFAKIPIN